MRTTILALAGLASLVAANVNISSINDVDPVAARYGMLAWGASGVPFGYNVGCGLSFDTDNGTVTSNFNGAIPGEWDGTFAGFSLMNDTSVGLGLGGVLGGKQFDIALWYSKGKNSQMTVKVNDLVFQVV